MPELIPNVTRLRARSNIGYGMLAHEGDLATFTFGAEYVPGWDAGRWDVMVDRTGKGCSHWTREELLEHWEVLDV